MALISKQRAEDADKDAITLSKHVNGTVDDPPNVNRAGNDVENLAKIRATALAMAADVANRQVYLTEAEMLADTAQPINTPARVETGAGAGDYVMTATGWVWSDVQPVNRSEVDSIQAQADATSTQVAGLQIEVGSGDYVEASFGNIEIFTQASLAEYLFGNNVPLPSGAYVRHVELHFTGAATGQLHVMSPNEGGGTVTRAIYSVSASAAGVTRVVLGQTFDAGSWFVYKSLSGVSVSSAVGQENPIGVVRYDATASSNVGDLQPAGPAVAATAQIAMRVSYTISNGTPLHLRVDQAQEDAADAQTTAVAAKDASDLTTAFLQTYDVQWSPTTLGDAETLPSSITNTFGYGPGVLATSGYLSAVRAYYDAAASGLANIDVIDNNKILIARYTVPVVGGLNEWSAEAGHFARIFVPSGGTVLLRRVAGSTGGFKFQSVGDGNGNIISTAAYTQATQVGDVQEYDVRNNQIVAVQIQWDVASRNINELIAEQKSIPPTLLDERFESDADWSLVGATIDNGLISGDSSSWASRCYPISYGFSILNRKTRSVIAEITAPNQVWGIGSIREVDATQLNTPASIVDGTSNSLRIYGWDSAVDTPPSPITHEVAIPWVLEGARVRLTEKRVRFTTTITLANMVSGESVEVVMDYAAGTGESSGRAAGRPAILFPSTVSGGVKVTSYRIVADYPFPSGSAARFLAMGDSNTETSQNGNDYNKGWAYLIEDERAAAGAPDTVVIARGGYQSGHLLNATPEAVKLCDENTIVVILIGTNDANQNVPLETTRANIQAIVNALKTKTKRISVACLPPQGATPNGRRALIVEDALNMYWGNDLLPPVRFDLALSLNNDGETRNPELYVENTHLNTPGHVVAKGRAILDLPEILE